MSEKIKPALTAEEWERLLRGDIAFASGNPDHAGAAVRLYDQPFGFTREDVEALDDVLDALDDKMQRGPEGIEVHIQPQYDAISSLRYRIMTLIPPEDAPSP